MTRSDLHRLLDGLTCTRPFTLEDARALYTLIKHVAPNAYVDVYTTRGDAVHVCVGDLTRDLPVS